MTDRSQDKNKASILGPALALIAGAVLGVLAIIGKHYGLALIDIGCVAVLMVVLNLRLDLRR